MMTDDEAAIEAASRHTEPLRSKQLVSAARSGSAAAFAELREMYAQRIYRKLLIITRNREDAEDALQTLFCERIRGCTPSKKGRAFIPGLARLRSTLR